MPKFVVPLVATTAKKVSGPCSSSTSRSRSPVRRHFSSTSTPTISASMTWQAESMEECAALVAAIRQGRAPAPVRPRGWPGPSRSRARRPAPRGFRWCRRGRTRPRARRQPSEVGDPAQRLVLGIDGSGALEPGAAVDRGRPDHEVEHRRRLGGRARDEAEVARVVGGDARRCEVLLEQLQRRKAPMPSGVMVCPATRSSSSSLRGPSSGTGSSLRRSSE